LTVTSPGIQAIHLLPPPVISAHGDNGLIWAVHPDGRIELGEHYTPDEAATSFWDAVKRLQPTLEQATGIKQVEAKLRAGAFRDGADRIRRTELPDDYIDTFDAGADWAATLMDQAAREADPK